MENKNYYKLKRLNININISKIDLLFEKDIKNIEDDIVFKKLEKALSYNLFLFHEKVIICKFIYSCTKNLQLKERYFYYFNDKYKFYEDFREILSRKLYGIAFGILENNLGFIENDVDIKKKIIKDLLKINNRSYDYGNTFFIKENNILVNRYFNLLEIFFNKNYPLEFCKLLNNYAQVNKEFQIVEYLKDSNIYEIIVKFYLLQTKMNKKDADFIRSFLYRITNEILKNKIINKKQEILDSLNYIKENQILHNSSIIYIEKFKNQLFTI